MQPDEGGQEMAFDVLMRVQSAEGADVVSTFTVHGTVSQVQAASWNGLVSEGDNYSSDD